MAPENRTWRRLHTFLPGTHDVEMRSVQLQSRNAPGTVHELGSDDREKGSDPVADRPSRDPREVAASEPGLAVHPRLMDRHMQVTLGRRLRVMFEDVSSSPVPDKLLQLLQDLENKERGQGK